MKKIWYLKETGTGENKSIKLFLYTKNNHREGKLDLSVFGNQLLEATMLQVNFQNEAGDIVGSLDLSERQFFVEDCLNGKGKLGADLAESLCKVGDKLRLSVLMDQKCYISDGWIRKEIISPKTEDNVLLKTNSKKRENRFVNTNDIEIYADKADVATDDKMYAKKEDDCIANSENIEAEELLQEGEGKRRIVQLEVLEEELYFRNFLHNSFLLHGYYNYGHVVIDETGLEVRLGVPGNYYEREQMVASMFGFPYFEPAREKDVVSCGTFGYYYTQTND